MAASTWSRMKSTPVGLGCSAPSSTNSTGSGVGVLFWLLLVSVMPKMYGSTAAHAE